MGIAGMILGILAVVFAIIPIIGWIISIPCLLIGLPLSIIGLLQNRKRSHGYGMAIAGIVTNVVAIVVVILWIFLFVASTEVTDVELGFTAERVPLMPLIYPPGNHIRPGSTFEGEYNSTPPTSGPHWDSGWAGCGFFVEEMPDEQVVHNMEHGQVIISYNLSDEDEIEQLREIARTLLGRRSWMIMRPYSKIDAGRIALTSWDRKDEFSISELTDERVRNFYDAHRNNSGVESIPCGGFMS